MDNAKIYHANAWKSACYRISTHLLHRPPREPEAGGCIERFIQTIQGQFEAEIRAGQILGLAELNRGLSAWLHVSYHQRVHSETNQTPHERYQKGLTIIRQVDMQRVLQSFLHTEKRTVNKDFADVRLENRYYRVDPKLRGDRVEVRFDPFARADTVEIYSLNGQYLGTGHLHHRQEGLPATEAAKGKARYNYTDLLIREHKKQLAEQVGGVDYRKAIEPDSWPFHELAKTVADLLGRKGGLAGLATQELEALQKVYNQNVPLNRQMVKQAFETAFRKICSLYRAGTQPLDRKGEKLMFTTFFNLTANPFMENPPIDWILCDPRMEDALARLKFFQNQGLMALVIGQTGIGKTTLLRLFSHHLPQNRYLPLYLHLTPISTTAFFRLIVTKLGEAPKLGKDRLFLQIMERVQKDEKCTLLFIDEAHLLDPGTLTDLRLLISDADNQVPLKIILSGQEPLRQTLKRASHADLVNRIAVRCALHPLSKDQTSAYIDRRITMAGGSPKIFEPEAKNLIHDYTGGVPRLINNVATACLINAAAKNLNKIAEALVNSTMAEFHLP